MTRPVLLPPPPEDPPSDGSDPAIRVEHLSKCYRRYRTPLARLLEMFAPRRRHRYTETWALRDINFTVDPGTTLGLLGSNGSGKTTLLRTLAGTTHPSKGRVEVRGRTSAILELSAGFRRDLSGGENLEFGAALMGLHRDALARLYPSILRFSGLGNTIDEPLWTYSMGQVMRLAFSLAMHLDFDVLLVDEVILVGDLLFQRQCLRKIREFQEQGRTIVLASHSLSDLATVATRMMVIDSGRVVEDGGTEDVLRRYVERVEYQANCIEGGPELFGPRLISNENEGHIRIKSVRFLDGAGNEAPTFAAGEPLTIEIHYEALRPVRGPLFRVQMYRNDGLWIMGSNTYRWGLSDLDLRGEGVARLQYGTLNLNAGQYYVSVGIWPDEYRSLKSKLPYDLHEMAYILTVRSSREHGGGFVHSPHSWSIEDERGLTRGCPEDSTPAPAPLKRLSIQR